MHTQGGQGAGRCRQGGQGAGRYRQGGQGAGRYRQGGSGGRQLLAGGPGGRPSRFKSQRRARAAGGSGSLVLNLPVMVV